MPYTSLRSAFTELALACATTIFRGRVVSNRPLQIQIDNDMKLILHENILCVPLHLTDYSVSCVLTNVGESDEDNEEELEQSTQESKILIRNALRTGDRVFLLSFNEGKKYFVLDREA